LTPKTIGSYRVLIIAKIKLLNKAFQKQYTAPSFFYKKRMPSSNTGIGGGAGGGAPAPQ